MKYLIPGSFGRSEEPRSPAQATPIDETLMLSPAGVMCSTLLQLRTHVETEKLERTTLKQLVQRLQRDFALLQPQIEQLDGRPTSKSSLVKLEKNQSFREASIYRNVPMPFEAQFFTTATVNHGPSNLAV